MNKYYSVIDLFCGCGGLSLGMKSADVRVKIVGAIDFNKWAVKSYKYNFPQVNPTSVLCADIIETPPYQFEKLIDQKEIDIVIGGPPCPGFSTIGRSKIMNLIMNGKWGESSEVRHAFIDDPRNKLFYEYVKYIEYFKPKIFLFENVKGIGSYKKKRGDKVLDIMDVIEEEFRNKGYYTDRKLLNSADFGVPQLRERYFILGVRNDLSDIFDFTFPSPTHKSIFKKDKNKVKFNNYFDYKEKKLEEEELYPIIENILLPYVTSLQSIIDLPIVEFPADRKYNYNYNIDEAVEMYKKKHISVKDWKWDDKIEKSIRKFLRIIRGENNYLISGKGDIYTITCHIPKRVNDLGDKEIFPLLRNEPNKKFIYGDLKDDNPLKRYKNKGFKDRMRRIPWWKPGWTIIAHLKVDGYMFIHPDTNQNRQITVREAARIQSFPDTFDFSARGEISRGNQYAAVGNAVPPILARALGLNIVKWLDDKNLEYEMKLKINK